MTSGTVIAVAYGPDKAMDAQVATQERCGVDAVERLVFGKGGRFESRVRQGTGPNPMFSLPLQESVAYDTQGRVRTHYMQHDSWGPTWGSPIDYSYGDHSTSLTFVDDANTGTAHRADAGNDGVADIVTDLTLDQDGAILQGSERNMLQSGPIGHQSTVVFRVVTPLCASPQGA